MATPYHAMPKLQSDPIVTVHPRDSTGSARTLTESAVEVHVTIRRGRLALLATLLLAAIVSLALVFESGFELFRFDGNTKDSSAQSQLLDKYNSYSGNVASVFGKPVELFVVLVTQIFVLRFLAESFTRSEPSWKAGAVTLVLATSVGYLVSNGFNALNVQLRPLDVKPMMTTDDLSVASSNFSSTTAAARTSSVTQSIPEAAPDNAITNSVLRNLVMPAASRLNNVCTFDVDGAVDLGDYVNTAQVADHFVSYGFQQRDWQSRVLQEAAKPTQLRLVVNPTNKTANAGVKSADLPMNATLAADLFSYSLLLAPFFLPWGVQRKFINDTAVQQLYPSLQPNDTNVRFGMTATDSMAVMAGLLPLNASVSDEATLREWFLHNSQAAAKLQFANCTTNTIVPQCATNSSLSNIGLEFSHVQVAPQVTFDAVTWEVDVDPSLLATASTKDGKTWYTKLDTDVNCGPWPGVCMFAKPRYSATPLDYDAPAMVLAMAACVNQTGSETLTYTMSRTALHNRDSIDCSRASNNSLIVLSLAKRLVADKLEQNATAATGASGVRNLRKIYSLTVGRLAWELTDLSAQFNAECLSDGDPVACLGLHLPLSPPLNAAAGQAQARQHLVVGAAALPTPSLSLATSIFTLVPRFQPLVRVSEPFPFESSQIETGDALLPHNIGNTSWDKESINQNCDPHVEDRLRLIRDNHYYMEHSLQPAYTAATFFLFQNAAVKDTITLSSGRQSLSFASNSQMVAVWISTPTQNAWLTLGGCALIALGLLAVAFQGMRLAEPSRDPLAKITEPGAIARVMLDGTQFPSLLLHRRVVATDEGRRIGGFMIDGLALLHGETSELVKAASSR